MGKDSYFSVLFISYLFKRREPHQSPHFEIVTWNLPKFRRKSREIFLGISSFVALLCSLLLFLWEGLPASRKGIEQRKSGCGEYLCIFLVILSDNSWFFQFFFGFLVLRGFFLLRKIKRKESVRRVVGSTRDDRSSPLLPPRLGKEIEFMASFKWKHWAWGGKSPLPCLGSLGVSLQDVGWDPNISQGSFLFSRPCQESDSTGGFRITCPGKTGARGGWSSLSQSRPESAASTRPRARKLVLLLELADTCTRTSADDSEGAVFTDTLLTKSLWQFAFTLQNLYVKCVAFSQEKSVAFRYAFLWCHW